MTALVIIVGVAFSLYYFSSVSEVVVEGGDEVVIAMTEDVTVAGKCSERKSKIIEAIANNNENIRECQLSIGQQRIAIRNHNAKKGGYSDVRVDSCLQEIAQCEFRILQLIAENNQMSKKL